MANFSKAKKAAQTEITKTEYWLNFELPAGKIGINLANGISQHETYLELIEKHGTEKFNRWLEKHGVAAYATQEGIRTNTSKFDDEFADL